MRMWTVPFVALWLTAGAISSAHAADEAKKEVDTKDVEKRMEQARKKMEDAAREMAELSASSGWSTVPDRMVFLGRNPNRGVLGIVIPSENENKHESGVEVLSVSPEGPASKGGIKAGDVLIELNGKSLKKDKDSSPPEKLREILSKLSPGDDASVRYTRDGKAAVVKLKVDRLPREEVRVRRMEIPDFNSDHFRQFDHLSDTMRVFSVRGASALGDLEMITLTPTMGQYFGTDKGLLIVRAPKDNKQVQLEDGDVLLDIDGRAPTDPGHAYRILRSYQPGEKLTLNIMRQRKKIAVPVTTPERTGSGDAVMPLPPMPPGAPPTAPTPAPTKRTPIT